MRLVGLNSSAVITALDLREIRDAISALSGLIYALRSARGDGH